MSTTAPAASPATYASHRAPLSSDARLQAPFESQSVPGRSTKEDAEEEWFFLSNLHREWQQAERPEENELYDKVRAMLPPGRSLEYYQGAYNLLVSLFPLLEVILSSAADNPFRGQEQAAVADVTRLLMGDTVGRILQKWPEEWIPKITDAGKPRATRHTDGTTRSGPAADGRRSGR